MPNPIGRLFNRKKKPPAIDWPAQINSCHDAITAYQNLLEESTGAGASKKIRLLVELRKALRDESITAEKRIENFKNAVVKKLLQTTWDKNVEKFYNLLAVEIQNSPDIKGRYDRAVKRKAINDIADEKQAENQPQSRSVQQYTRLVQEEAISTVTSDNLDDHVALMFEVIKAHPGGDTDALIGQLFMQNIKREILLDNERYKKTYSQIIKWEPSIVVDTDFGDRCREIFISVLRQAQQVVEKEQKKEDQAAKLVSKYIKVCNSAAVVNRMRLPRVTNRHANWKVTIAEEMKNAQKATKNPITIKLRELLAVLNATDLSAVAKIEKFNEIIDVEDVVISQWQNGGQEFIAALGDDVINKTLVGSFYLQRKEESDLQLAINKNAELVSEVKREVGAISGDEPELLRQALLNLAKHASVAEKSVAQSASDYASVKETSKKGVKQVQIEKINETNLALAERFNDFRALIQLFARVERLNESRSRKVQDDVREILAKAEGLYAVLGQPEFNAKVQDLQNRCVDIVAHDARFKGNAVKIKKLMEDVETLLPSNLHEMQVEKNNLQHSIQELSTNLDDAAFQEKFQELQDYFKSLERCGDLTPVNANEMTNFAVALYGIVEQKKKTQPELEVNTFIDIIIANKFAQIKDANLLKADEYARIMQQIAKWNPKSAGRVGSDQAQFMTNFKNRLKQVVLWSHEIQRESRICSEYMAKIALSGLEQSTDKMRIAGELKSTLSDVNVHPEVKLQEFQAMLEGGHAILLTHQWDAAAEKLTEDLGAKAERTQLASAYARQQQKKELEILVATIRHDIQTVKKDEFHLSRGLAIARIKQKLQETTDSIDNAVDLKAISNTLHELHQEYLTAERFAENVGKLLGDVVIRNKSRDARVGLCQEYVNSSYEDIATGVAASDSRQNIKKRFYAEAEILQKMDSLVVDVSEALGSADLLKVDVVTSDTESDDVSESARELLKDSVRKSYQPGKLNDKYASILAEFKKFNFDRVADIVVKLQSHQGEHARNVAIEKLKDKLGSEHHKYAKTNDYALFRQLLAEQDGFIDFDLKAKNILDIVARYHGVNQQIFKADINKAVDAAYRAYAAGASLHDVGVELEASQNEVLIKQLKIMRGDPACNPFELIQGKSAAAECYMLGLFAETMDKPIVGVKQGEGPGADDIMPHFMRQLWPHLADGLKNEYCDNIEKYNQLFKSFAHFPRSNYAFTAYQLNTMESVFVALTPEIKFQANVASYVNELEREIDQAVDNLNLEGTDSFNQDLQRIELGYPTIHYPRTEELLHELKEETKQLLKKLITAKKPAEKVMIELEKILEPKNLLVVAKEYKALVGMKHILDTSSSYEDRALRTNTLIEENKSHKSTDWSTGFDNFIEKSFGVEALKNSKYGEIYCRKQNLHRLSQTIHGFERVGGMQEGVPIELVGRIKAEIKKLNDHAHIVYVGSSSVDRLIAALTVKLENLSRLNEVEYSVREAETKNEERIYGSDRLLRDIAHAYEHLENERIPEKLHTQKDHLMKLDQLVPMVVAEHMADDNGLGTRAHNAYDQLDFEVEYNGLYEGYINHGYGVHVKAMDDNHDRSSKREFPRVRHDERNAIIRRLNQSYQQAFDSKDMAHLQNFKTISKECAAFVQLDNLATRYLDIGYKPQYAGEFRKKIVNAIKKAVDKAYKDYHQTRDAGRSATELQSTVNEILFQKIINLKEKRHQAVLATLMPELKQRLEVYQCQQYYECSLRNMEAEIDDAVDKQLNSSDQALELFKFALPAADLFNAYMHEPLDSVTTKWPKLNTVKTDCKKVIKNKLRNLQFDSDVERLNFFEQLAKVGVSRESIDQAHIFHDLIDTLSRGDISDNDKIRRHDGIIEANKVVMAVYNWQRALKTLEYHLDLIEINNLAPLQHVVSGRLKHDLMVAHDSRSGSPQVLKLLQKKCAKFAEINQLLQSILNTETTGGVERSDFVTALHSQAAALYGHFEDEAAIGKLRDQYANLQRVDAIDKEIRDIRRDVVTGDAGNERNALLDYFHSQSTEAYKGRDLDLLQSQLKQFKYIDALIHKTNSIQAVENRHRNAAINKLHHSGYKLIGDWVLDEIDPDISSSSLSVESAAAKTERKLAVWQAEHENFIKLDNIVAEIRALPVYPENDIHGFLNEFVKVLKRRAELSYQTKHLEKQYNHLNEFYVKLSPEHIKESIKLEIRKMPMLEVDAAKNAAIRLLKEATLDHGIPLEDYYKHFVEANELLAMIDKAGAANKTRQASVEAIALLVGECHRSGSYKDLADMCTALRQGLTKINELTVLDGLIETVQKTSIQARDAVIASLEKRAIDACLGRDIVFARDVINQFNDFDAQAGRYLKIVSAKHAAAILACVTTAYGQYATGPDAGNAVKCKLDLMKEIDQLGIRADLEHRASSPLRFLGKRQPQSAIKSELTQASSSVPLLKLFQSDNTQALLKRLLAIFDEASQDQAGNQVDEVVCGTQLENILMRELENVVFTEGFILENESSKMNVLARIINDRHHDESRSSVEASKCRLVREKLKSCVNELYDRQYYFPKYKQACDQAHDAYVKELAKEQGKSTKNEAQITILADKLGVMKDLKGTLDDPTKRTAVKINEFKVKLNDSDNMRKLSVERDKDPIIIRFFKRVYNVLTGRKHTRGAQFIETAKKLETPEPRALRRGRTAG